MIIINTSGLINKYHINEIIIEALRNGTDEEKNYIMRFANQINRIPEIDISPKPKDDIVIISVTPTTLTKCQLYDLRESLRKLWGDIDIIVMPNSAFLRLYSKSELRKLREAFLSTIDKLIGNNKS